MIADALEAAITILKHDSEVQEMVDRQNTLDWIRIFGDEMPKKEAKKQPRQAIVLRHAPTVQPVGGFVELQRVGFDAFCYGYNPKEAVDLYNAMSGALKHHGRAQVDTVLVHSFEQSISGRALREPESQWPFMLSSWTCLASENRVDT